MIVDIEYEVYKCPHCDGYLAVRKQFPHMEMGCSTSLEHWSKLPDWLDKPTREHIGVVEM